ncbi:MAG: response regulator [Cyclobacteriaceae bacterium]
MKFVIIENDEICVFINKKVLLKANGHLEIDAFTKAQDALAYLAENQASSSRLPDVILLDINMPVMSGWDFLNAFSEIKHKLAKVPAIYVLSSTLWPPELERISSHPMISGFISKPFKVENALQLIEEVT